MRPSCAWISGVRQVAFEKSKGPVGPMPLMLLHCGSVAEQRARDSDARRILSDELKREEERLAALQREYNNGEPERLGSERNYARYQERVAGMRAAIQRKEADIAAIRRELGKLPP